MRQGFFLRGIALPLSVSQIYRANGQEGAFSEKQRLVFTAQQIKTGFREKKEGRISINLPVGINTAQVSEKKKGGAGSKTPV